LEATKKINMAGIRVRFRSLLVLTLSDPNAARMNANKLEKKIRKRLFGSDTSGVVRVMLLWSRDRRRLDEIGANETQAFELNISQVILGDSAGTANTQGSSLRLSPSALELTIADLEVIEGYSGAAVSEPDWALSVTIVEEDDGSKESDADPNQLEVKISVSPDSLEDTAKQLVLLSEHSAVIDPRKTLANGGQPSDLDDFELLLGTEALAVLSTRGPDQVTTTEPLPSTTTTPVMLARQNIKTEEQMSDSVVAAIVALSSVGALVIIAVIICLLVRASKRGARQKFMQDLKTTQNMKLVKTQASISRRSLEADMASKQEEERARIESMALSISGRIAAPTSITIPKSTTSRKTNRVFPSTSFEVVPSEVVNI